MRAADTHEGFDHQCVAADRRQLRLNPTPKVFSDKSQDHDVVVGKPDGALLSFGTGKNTDISVSTGCHRTAEAHRRGSPTPTS
ncbi:LppA family lipoprotein [Amycolatopsis sp. NPDC059021]|uniref:LppA family lipoprotein n=1 Tax=Amycolatopsis sp. NPDC059021 TaxID=3346704 RepID=UPI003670A4B9